MKFLLTLSLFSVCLNSCNRSGETRKTYLNTLEVRETSRNVSVDGLSKSDSIITRVKLLNAKGLFSESNDLQILSFTYLFGNCELAERLVSGSKFLERDKKYFLIVRPGPMLHFYDIKAKDSKDNIIFMKPFNYKFIE